MLRRALPLLLIFAACSSNPEPQAPAPQPQPARPAAFDPVGNYDFNIELMGQTQSGDLSITRQEGKLVASVTASGETVKLQNVTLDGQKVTATATPPQGGPEVTFTFNFEPDGKFAGTLVIPGMGEARMFGARKKT